MAGETDRAQPGMDVDGLGQEQFEALCRDLLRTLGAGAGGRVVAVSRAHQRPASAEDWWRVARVVAMRLPTALGADLLGALLRLPELHVIEAAARALVAIAPQVGAERAAAALLPLATSGEPAREQIALRALGQIGYPKAVEALTRATRSRNRATRHAAYAALAGIDSPEARRLLVSSLGLLSPRKWEVLAALLYPGARGLSGPPQSMLGPCSPLQLAVPLSPGLPSPWTALRWVRQTLQRRNS